MDINEVKFLFEEFLEEHFEEEDRDTHRNSPSTFRQFIEEEEIEIDHFTTPLL